MLDDTRFDAQIAALYVAGTNAIEIARRLDLRVPDVIGRIRAQDLKPVGMAERRVATPEPTPPELTNGPARSETIAEVVTLRPETARDAARPAPARPPINRPAPPRVLRHSGNTALKAVEAFDEDDDDEDGGMVRYTGRPKGWLISETRMNEMYARLGRGY